MCPKTGRQATGNIDSIDSATSIELNSIKKDRRKFLRDLGIATTTSMALVGANLGPLAGKAGAHSFNDDGGQGEGALRQRVEEAFDLRRDAAFRDLHSPIPNDPANGDEQRYPNRIGNYSKGLPHDSLGIVEASAYDALLRATSSGRAADFDLIPMGGNVPLADPQSGLTFDLEGLDSHQFKIDPAPAFASAQRAGEAAECYWMTLLRDINFTDYATNPTALAACAELSKLSDFRGPKVNGSVTPASLFRGNVPGDMTGPYVSQFLLQPVNYGAIPITQAIHTYLPLSNGGSDYLTDVPSWLAVQNGQGPFAKNRTDSIPRYIRNGRDLSAYVHVDQFYEAYFNACLWFNDHKAPLSPGNPYINSKTQTGGSSFGLQHVQGMLGFVSVCASRAVYYQKWFVHRTVRPEEFGGHLHFMLSGAADYPIHPDILHSQAVAEVFSKNGTYLLPHAFPEGCPQHPSYAQGHASIAGACVTLLKAFFDESTPIQNLGEIVQASEDGLSLIPYEGADAGEMTVGSELNKLASNIGIARNHAAVHWRSDYFAALLLGEAVTIAILRDERHCFSEIFDGFTFTKFDGTKITI